MDIRFTKYIPQPNDGDPFQRMLNLFLQLMQFTDGDPAEALQWMNQLDQEYNLTNDEYAMGDFIDELKRKGYLKENPETGKFEVTEKTNQTIRKKSLGRNFRQAAKSSSGKS